MTPQIGFFYADGLPFLPLSSVGASFSPPHGQRTRPVSRPQAPARQGARLAIPCMAASCAAPRAGPHVIAPGCRTMRACSTCFLLPPSCLCRQRRSRWVVVHHCIESISNVCPWMQSSKIGMSVNMLRKSPHAQVSKAATDLVRDWRRFVAPSAAALAVSTSSALIVLHDSGISSNVIFFSLRL
jgi:hypothetical protein